MPQLILVDDERNVLNALARVCRNAGIPPQFGDLRISVFASPYAALEFARHYCVDVVVSDYRMPEMNGATLLAKIRGLQPDAVRLMLSATADLAAVIRSVNEAQIFRFVAKPWNSAEMKRTIAEALAAAARNTEQRRLADETRAQQGVLTAEEFALRQLEAESPGITRVERSADGGVLLVE